MGFLRNISAKILIPVIIMTATLVAVTVTVSTHNFSQLAEESFNKEIQNSSRNLEQNIIAQRVIASDQTNSLAQNTRIIAAIKEGNREKIQDIFAKFESKQKCSFFTALDPEGKVIFRTSRPEQFGDPLGHLRGVKETMTA